MNDFYKMERLSDEVFQEYMKMFSYAKTPLNPALESAAATWSDSRRESVSVDSAYGERFTIHLDLPAKASPRYQAVVYFPGANALEQKTFGERTGSGSTTSPEADASSSGPSWRACTSVP